MLKYIEAFAFGCAFAGTLSSIAFTLYVGSKLVRWIDMRAGFETKARVELRPRLVLWGYYGTRIGFEIATVLCLTAYFTRW